MRSALAAAAPATPFPFRTRTLVSERVSIWRIEPFFLAVSGSGPATFVTAASCTRAETPRATCVPTMIPSTPSSSRARAVATIVAVRQREVVSTREPGGTELGERVRALVLDGPDLSPWAEAALFAAARAQLVEEVIAPALR